jgi:hypothetical protein
LRFERSRRVILARRTSSNRPWRAGTSVSVANDSSGPTAIASADGFGLTGRFAIGYAF